jgi:YidC/Oxa1 family membrane protein insertase
VSFNFFSLDYLYYPVSGIMWVWHKVFGAVLGPNNAWAWVLSVVFLVFTLRAILFKPFLKQMESQLKMQAVQPRMKALRAKYKDDRQRLAEEMMKLNKEAGVSPLGGCLPALIQAPVFIGLFHVLRMFQPIPNGGGGWMFRHDVYFFGPADVQSFGLAKLFGGAPLGGSMRMGIDQLAFMGGIREHVIWVGIPLTILAGIATHLTSRRSVSRQREINPEAASAPQAAMMNKLMLYVFPAFVVIGGPFFPLAILFYWLANNSWTFGQLRLAHTMQDKRQAAEALQVQESKEVDRFSTPRPGAKPRPGTKPLPGSRPQLTKRQSAVEPVVVDGTAGTVLPLPPGMLSDAERPAATRPPEPADPGIVMGSNGITAGGTSGGSSPAVAGTGGRGSAGGPPGSRPQAATRNRTSSKKKKKRR